MALRLGTWLTVLATVGLPQIAHAQAVDDATRSAARNLASAGVQAYQANDYPAARDKLERAYQVLRAPSLGLWSARALVKVGALVEAGERY
ncbi:MAG TPA: tetratricopeptide repeat protein, partial [Polyangiaceae bacterium]